MSVHADSTAYHHHTTIIHMYNYSLWHHRENKLFVGDATDLIVCYHLVWPLCKCTTETITHMLMWLQH